MYSLSQNSQSDWLSKCPILDKKDSVRVVLVVGKYESVCTRSFFDRVWKLFWGFIVRSCDLNGVFSLRQFLLNLLINFTTIGDV